MADGDPEREAGRRLDAFVDAAFAFSVTLLIIAGAEPTASLADLSLLSYAMGRAGDFALKPTADGYVWEIPSGPATIRYTVVIKDGVWHEVGERTVQGQAPMKFFEMTLKRVGDSPWPGAGAVAPN